MTAQPPTPAPVLVAKLADDVAAFLRAHGVPAPTLPVYVQSDLRSSSGGEAVAVTDYGDGQYDAPRIVLDREYLRAAWTTWQWRISSDLAETLMHEEDHAAQGPQPDGPDDECVTSAHGAVEAVARDLAWRYARPLDFPDERTWGACAQSVSRVRRMSTAACRVAVGALPGDTRCAWPGRWASTWRVAFMLGETA